MMPKRIPRSKRFLQGTVRRYQARAAIGPKVHEVAAPKQQLNIDELLAFSEAHYAQLMLSKMEKRK